MKKLKQITALIGVIALAGLYVSTLVLALIGNEQCINPVSYTHLDVYKRQQSALGIYGMIVFALKSASH